MSLSRAQQSFILVTLIIVADQALKIWVKTHMHLGENIPVLGNWFSLLFIENEGFAFGLKLKGDYGKLILSLFRIAMSVGIIWYIPRLIKREGMTTGFILGVSSILAGAIGNLIDCMFYGLIFSESTVQQVATMFPPGGGYGKFLHGHVVDMLSFHLFEGHYPTWFPFVGGQHFMFFQFVFNIADSAVTIGILYLLIFQWKVLNQVLNPSKTVGKNQ